ncbi:MAG: radical SAM protein [Nanoarchaeota archaeon]
MNENKIFLLETSVEEQNRLEYSPDGTYALGMAYLDSVLQKQGYKVLTKDFAQFSELECLKRVKIILDQFKPNLVGISMMSMTRVSSFKVIELIKKQYPGVKIVLGGVHPTVMYEQLLNNFPIDCVIIGEGERTLVELLPALFSNKKLDKINGIAFRKNKKIIKTKERELICDLDSIPFPNHEAFMNPKRKRIALLSSRGCPNICSFCALYLISRRRYRMRSYQNVVDEIEFLVKKFPQIKEIEFSDDTFTLSEERVINFCKEIVKRQIHVKFICSARIKPASEEMFYWMEKAGFKEIRFGIETGSRKMLVSIHKGITIEQIIETFKIASKFKKIKFVKFLMVGFPGENEDTVKETIELTKKLQKLVPMDFFYATPLWVYPGTEVYEQMKKAKKIDDKFWLSNKSCPHYTVEHTEEEILNMSNRISFETSLDRGYYYFLILILKKMLTNPKEYTKRMINFVFKR